MAGNIVVGKNNGGFSENPPNLTHHLFTCNVILRKKKENPPNSPVILQSSTQFFFQTAFCFCFKVKEHLKLNVL